MEIMEVPFEPDAVFGVRGGLDLAKNPHARSVGVHLYDILEDFDNRFFARDTSHSDFTKADLMCFREMGFVWEVVVEWVFAARRGEGRERPDVIRQMEFISDGIIMTPDAIDVSVNPRVVEEYKWTTKSMRLPITDVKYMRWRMQQMAYCRAAGTSYGRLVVMYSCGDWKPHRHVPKQFLIQYHPQEIEDNWHTILNHKALMEREGKLRVY